MQGLLPIERSRVPAEVLAGLTLAAVGIPAVLGYAKIAGMPLVTGLHTMLLPMAVYAVLGSSRHLMVAADSATAVILAAALTGLAMAGSERYVRDTSDGAGSRPPRGGDGGAGAPPLTRPDYTAARASRAFRRPGF